MVWGGRFENMFKHFTEVRVPLGPARFTHVIRNYTMLALSERRFARVHGCKNICDLVCLRVLGKNVLFVVIRVLHIKNNYNMTMMEANQPHIQVE